MNADIIPECLNRALVFDMEQGCKIVVMAWEFEEGKIFLGSGSDEKFVKSVDFRMLIVIRCGEYKISNTVFF